MQEDELERGLISLRRRETGLRFVIGAYLACTAATLILWGSVIGRGLDQEGEHPLVLAAGFSGLAYALCFVASVIAVCLWVHRAHANLLAAGIEGLEFKPNMAVGWYFVPFAFWFKPFQAMRELWNASHLANENQPARAERMLIAWWACWVLGNLIANGSTTIGDITSPITVLDLTGYGFHLVAGATLLLIANAITKAQASEMSVHHAFA